MVPLLLSTLFACGPMAIEGEIVDVMGQPIVGARVTSMGTPCSTLTDKQGHFDLECQPGSHRVVITIEGYLSKEETIEAPERKRYKMGKYPLVKIPSARGLFRFADDAYVPLKPGRLARKMTAAGVTRQRAYCLDKDRSEPNAASPGPIPLFDNETIGWRPFKLDEEGCAYRDSRNESGRWVVEYRERAEYEEKTMSRGKKIARIALAPGEYFIADWKGFFVPAEDDKKSYTGYWIQVAK